MLSERGQSLLKWALYAIIAISVIMTAISVASGFIMDYYWFSAVGYLQVFMVNIKYQLALLFLGWAVTTVSLLLTWRTIDEALGDQLPSVGGKIYKIAAVIAGFGVGWWFRGEYLTVLKFLNQAPWGSVDPVFAKDISFYVFTLPMIKSVLTFAAIVSGIVILFATISYGIGRFGIGAKKGEVGYSGESSFWSASRLMRSWPVLGSILVLVGIGAIGMWLGRFSYLWGYEVGSQVPVGASFMAIHYFIPYTWVKAFGMILLGVLVFRVFTSFGKIRERLEFGDWGALKKEIGLIIALIVIFAVVPGVVFGAINALEVKPNEPGIQRTYIERGIKYTNRAYDLDDAVEVTYPTSSENLTLGEALESPTVKNARIVDYRPIKTTYDQKQRLRTYYEFHDVDVDRYHVENKKLLTVISGREMDKEGGGWQNQHLFYTHGFGAVVSPASEVQVGGSPILSISDIPPVSDWRNVEIKEPRIYFGEETDDYVIVNAHGLKEFDYPKGESNIQYTYKKNRGIRLGNTWKKLISWFYTGDFKILVSNYVGKDSRLLLHRNVHERVEKIAPFLRYDSNAHLFIDNDGGLNYLLNGISWAERYPYSYSGGDAPGYLSDSVKAFVEANTGDVKFYPIDEEDPIVQTFSNIYPNLFMEEEMPKDFRNHLIYPPDLFQTQMRIFKRYHMSDYQSFYQKEDLWTPAEEKYHGRTKRLEAYNILLNVTGKPGFENNDEEFTLVRPFTPKGKRNMRAWVGVAQDPKNYGKMIALEFPKGQLARGPEQIEAIIDQDAEISERITLWDRAGSNVLRGNLLVLPVKDDILYIEPVYLSAETSAYPQLKRVVVAYRDRAVMENSLNRAVTSALAGKGAGPVIPGENLAPKKLVQVVQDYLSLKEKHDKLVSEGKYAEAGAVKENMVALLDNMKRLSA